MNIVGINAFHADASAAIFVNGKLIAAIEEERFTRVKHWSGFPAQSIQFCVEEAGLSIEEIDFFVIGRDPYAKFLKKILYVAKNPLVNIPAIKDRLFNAKKTTSIDEELALLFNKSITTFNNKIINIEHHKCHLASAFFASDFEKALCVSIDGSGDFSTTMIAIGNKNDLEIIESVDFPHSIGLFYTAFTQLLGFPNYGDEYKVMGMAPYGSPLYVNDLKKVLRCKQNGLFELDLQFFRKGTAGLVSYSENNIPTIQPLYSKKLEKIFGTARKAGEPITSFHNDLAASVQKITEETILHILNFYQKKTGLTNLCLAGGVAQNSVVNGKISSHTNFKQVYIPSAGSDAGISFGAALYLQHQIKKMPRQKAILSAYTGSKFSNEQIISILNEKGIGFIQLSFNEIYDHVTNCLIDGGVVGWMNGRSEFGPRALGARSILADPRRTDAKEILNAKIKRRESFRPFAPSILKEYVSEYFELEEPVPFMEKVFVIKAEKRSLIPAVTHIDGTGRLQSVDATVSTHYHQLIKTFYNKTGIPILLNTSFNENEPIVNNPHHAIDCFIRTNMDMLVMENILVTRKNLSLSKIS